MPTDNSKFVEFPFQILPKDSALHTRHHIFSVDPFDMVHSGGIQRNDHSTFIGKTH